MADVVCPQCTSLFRAEAGQMAKCPSCGYSGGVVPGAQEVHSFTPPEEFLPSDPFPDEDDEDEEVDEEAKKETSRVALTALILGLAVPIPFAGPVAVGFGIAGIVHVSKNEDEYKGKGLAIVGMVFGFLASIVWFILVVTLFAAGGRLVQGQ